MNNSHVQPTGFFRRLLAKTHALVNTLTFKSSGDYWEKRYAQGGNSGGGSYGKLAEFKAEIVNGFIHQYGIHSVVEFGCGDGNQLGLLDNTVDYLGLDVSTAAVTRCQKKFSEDKRKCFLTYDARRNLDPSLAGIADMSMSLDVIFHLVEDDVYAQYLSNLFGAAQRFVLIYSTDKDSGSMSSLPHVRHHRFSDRVAAEFQNWKLIQHVPNRYPLARNKDGSDAEFFLYKRHI